jgi:hypothetical protein
VKNFDLQKSSELSGNPWQKLVRGDAKHHDTGLQLQEYFGNLEKCRLQVNLPIDKPESPGKVNAVQKLESDESRRFKLRALPKFGCHSDRILRDGRSEKTRRREVNRFEEVCPTGGTHIGLSREVDRRHGNAGPQSIKQFNE